MVQVIQRGPSLGSLSGQILGKALGEGLGSFTGQYLANKSLQSVLANPELKNAPQSERLQALQSALTGHGEHGEKLLQSQLQFEQQREQENESRILGKAFKGEEISANETSRLRPETQLKLFQIKKDQQTAKRLKDDLMDIGIDENVAENYANLYRDSTEGGKTQILNHVLDLKKRGLVDNETPVQNEPLENLGNPKTDNEGFDWPKLNEEKGFTPSEIAKTRREREKTNIPFYNDVTKKVKASKEESLLLDRLEQLNPQMPEGFFGKVNVNLKNGDLRIPAGASPEAQLYVKTVNEFTKNAKDTYGSRLTNFDLSQFLKRLPTLSNSKEGRELIIRQMKIINELNKLESQSLKDVYNKYGVGNINHQQATSIADQYKSQKEDELVKRFKDLDGLLNQVDSGSQNTIKMIAPNGRAMNVPQEKVAEFEKLGAKRG